MADAGLSSLRSLVAEQQAQINYLSVISSSLVQAHFALREDHVGLCEQHYILCDCLDQGGLLSQASLRERMEAHRHAGQFCALMVETEIACSIISGAGVSAASRFSAASRLCMESVDALSLARTGKARLTRQPAPAMAAYRRPPGMVAGSGGPLGIQELWPRAELVDSLTDAMSDAALLEFSAVSRASHKCIFGRRTPEEKHEKTRRALNGVGMGLASSSTGPTRAHFAVGPAMEAAPSAVPRRRSPAQSAQGGGRCSRGGRWPVAQDARGGPSEKTSGAAAAAGIPAPGHIRSRARGAAGPEEASAPAAQPRSPLGNSRSSEDHRDRRADAHGGGQDPQDHYAELAEITERAAMLAGAARANGRERRGARFRGSDQRGGAWGDQHCDPGGREAAAKSLASPRGQPEQDGPQNGPHPRHSEFKRGQIVRIRGFRTDLDGQKGRLVSYKNFSMHWHVHLPSGESVKVPVESIEPAAGADAWEGAGRGPPQAPSSTLSLLTEVSHTSELFCVLASFIGRSEERALSSTSPAICRRIVAYKKIYVCRKLYVCRGYDSRWVFDGAEVLELGTGTWQALPPMSRGRLAAATAALEGDLYVCGGSDLQNVTASVERFSPAIGSWRAVKPMSSPRHSASTGVLGGLLYICGGCRELPQAERSCTFATNTAECYSPAAGEWRTLPPMSESRVFASAVVGGDGYFYISGGACVWPGLNLASFSSRWQAHVLSSAERFNPSTSSWQGLAQMSERRYSAAMASTVAGCLCVVGGHSGESVLASAERFSPAANSWEVLPPMSVPRFGAAVAVHGSGRLFICGGQNAKDALSSAECFDPEKGTWTQLSSMTEARTDATVAVVNSRLHVCGGHNFQKALRSAEVFNPEQGIWERLKAAPRK